MKELYFIRHGESSENIDGIFTAGSAQLSERGVAQAKHLAQKLKNTGVKSDFIYSSPYRRAVETANIIAKTLGSSVQKIDYIYEHAYLDRRHKGKNCFKDNEIMRIHNSAYRAWEFNDPGLAEDVSESFDTFLSRVDKFIDFVNQGEQNPILAVGHEAFAKLLLARVIYTKKLKAPDAYRLYKKIRIHNASLVRFEIDDNAEWTLKIS